jgi:hypothetical protein
MLPWHASAEIGVALVTAVTRLVSYAIDDGQRWRCFRFLALAVAVGWRLFADGGVRVLLHDFGQAGATACPVAVNPLGQISTGERPRGARLAG